MGSPVADRPTQLDASGDTRTRVQCFLDDMRTRERWPRDRLMAYQHEQLEGIVRYAVAHSPYYREAFGPASGDRIELSALPVLSKRTLIAEFDRIVTDPRLRLADAERHLASEHAAEPLFGEYWVVGTGGTTGQRSVAIYDQTGWEIVLSEILYVMAVQEIGDDLRVIGIGAPTPLHMTNRLFADLRAGRGGAPRLAVTTPLPEIVAALNAYRPDAIITYPSLIRRLAEEQQAGRLKIAPKKFCSVAETLTPAVRDLARDTWAAQVLDDYGATEAGLVAVECVWANGLHVPEDQVIVEVVDANNRPVPPGVRGDKVLLTNLFNRVVPLIRYQLSDLAIMAEGSCPCGRSHARLASVRGRQEDMLTLPSRGGGRVEINAFLFGETLLHVPAVRQYQLSPEPGGLSVRVVLRDTAPIEDTLQAARHAVEIELERAGAVVDTLTVEAVDDIARSGTGAKERLLTGVNAHPPGSGGPP
jgi:putative adenylate-forming enzyme